MIQLSIKLRWTLTNFYVYLHSLFLYVFYLLIDTYYIRKTILQLLWINNFKYDNGIFTAEKH